MATRDGNLLTGIVEAYRSGDRGGVPGTVHPLATPAIVHAGGSLEPLPSTATRTDALDVVRNLVRPSVEDPGWKQVLKLVSRRPAVEARARDNEPPPNRRSVLDARSGGEPAVAVLPRDSSASTRPDQQTQPWSRAMGIAFGPFRPWRGAHLRSSQAPSRVATVQGVETSRACSCGQSTPGRAPALLSQPLPLPAADLRARWRADASVARTAGAGLPGMLLGDDPPDGEGGGGQVPGPLGSLCRSSARAAVTCEVAPAPAVVCDRVDLDVRNAGALGSVLAVETGHVPAGERLLVFDTGAAPALLWKKHACVALQLGGAVFRTRVAEVRDPKRLALADAVPQGLQGVPLNVWVDDSVPIQETLNAAASRKGLTIVGIPEGVYPIGVPVPLEIKPDALHPPLKIGSNTILVGHGQGKTVLRLADRADIGLHGFRHPTVLMNSGSTWFHDIGKPREANRNREIHVASMTFDGNKQGQSAVPPGGGGLRVTGTALFEVGYVGGGVNEIWESLDVPGATGRNALLLDRVTPPGNKHTFAAGITLRDPVLNLESTISNIFRFATDSATPTLQLRLMKAPSRWHNDLDVFVYYRRHDPKFEVESDFPSIPLYQRKQIAGASIRQGVGSNDNLSFAVQLDEYRLLDAKGMPLPAALDSQSGWILMPPGRGITQKGNGKLSLLGVDNATDCVILDIEARDSACDGIDVSHNGLGGSVERVSLHQLRVHGSARTGLAIHGAVRDFAAYRCCLINNSAGACDIEDTGGLAVKVGELFLFDEFLVRDVSFEECVFAGGFYGLSVAVPPADGPRPVLFDGLRILRCDFFANAYHLNIEQRGTRWDPQAFRGILASCCNFDGSLQTACLIDAGNGKFHRCRFLENGQTHARYHRYSVVPNIGRGSDIFFGDSLTDRHHWEVTHCDFTMSARLNTHGYLTHNVSPAILIASGFGIGQPDIRVRDNLFDGSLVVLGQRDPPNPPYPLSDNAPVFIKSFSSFFYPLHFFDPNYCVEGASKGSLWPWARVVRRRTGPGMPEADVWSFDQRKRPMPGVDEVCGRLGGPWDVW